MCRYGFQIYKEHYACFDCRKVFRKEIASYPAPKTATCPECGGQMRRMGLDFKAPKRSDTKRWRIARTLAQNNILFDSCGCGGPGYRPSHPRELPVFLSRTQAHKKQPVVRLWKRSGRMMGPVC